jgi:hypothetical protein
MWNLRRYLRIAIDTIRYDGLGIFLWRVLVKALSPFGGLAIQFVFEKDLRRPLTTIAPRIPIVIAIATAADIDDIVAVSLGLQPNSRPFTKAQVARLARARGELAHEIGRAISCGEKFFIARVGSEIVHVNSSRFRCMSSVPGYTGRLRPGEVYTTDAFTAHGWRGNRIHEAVLTEMLRQAKAAGCQTAYTVTDLIAAGSRRGIRRLDWRLRGTLAYFHPRGQARAFAVKLHGHIDPLIDAHSEPQRR